MEIVQGRNNLCRVKVTRRVIKPAGISEIWE
jgi:hypothetical protein